MTFFFFLWNVQVCVFDQVKYLKKKNKIILKNTVVVVFWLSYVTIFLCLLVSVFLLLFTETLYWEKTLLVEY